MPDSVYNRFCVETPLACESALELVIERHNELEYESILELALELHNELEYGHMVMFKISNPVAESLYARYNPPNKTYIDKLVAIEEAKFHGKIQDNKGIRMNYRRRMKVPRINARH